MKGAWIWTIFMVAFAVVVSLQLNRDIVYGGTDIEFTGMSSRNLAINASSETTFEGASSDFFLLRKLHGRANHYSKWQLDCRDGIANHPSDKQSVSNRYSPYSRQGIDLV